MHVQICTFWPSAAAYRAAAHSQAPRAAAKQQQRQLEATCRFDTPLPIWCMRLCPGPSSSHERELKAQARSDAHRNSHLNLDFARGKAKLACALSCAKAGGSGCHRRAADGRGGAFSSTALRLTLRAAAAWTPSRCARSASKSPHSIPWVRTGALFSLPSMRS